MKIKNLIIYYPSFESGGVEKVIKNLIKYFISKSINIYLITSNKENLKIIKKQKNLKIIIIKKNYFRYLPSRLTSSINSVKYLYSLLRKMNNSNTIVHSMQSNFIPIVISKILNFKIVIRNSEEVRKLSVIVQLSDPDEYEGGEVQLMNDNNSSFFLRFINP